MKILLLSAYYEPEIAASMYLLTNINEALADYGHYVDVYTPVPTRGVTKKIRQQYKKKKIETLKNGHLIIHRFALMREKKGVFKRAFRYLLLNVKLIWIGLTHKTDLIFLYSTPPTNGLVARFLKKTKNKPIVYCIQDMFPESLVATGIVKRDSLVYRIGEVVEKLTYRGADHFIVISKNFMQEMIMKGVAPEKITVIPNWVDENAVKKIPRVSNRVIKRYHLDVNKFYVTYCGNIGFTQNIELILKVAEQLKNKQDIEFLFFGEGNYKETAEEYILENQLDHVKIFPFQDYEYISDVFSIGDVGFIASKPGVGNCSVPSKTWSYMSAECAIVASFDKGTELEKILQESGAGFLYEPDDLTALQQKIIALYEDRVLCKEIGQRGRKYVLNYLTKAQGAKKYVDILEKVYQKRVMEND